MAETATPVQEPPSEAYTILKDYDSDLEKTCAICGARADTTCGICHGTAYCGKAHETQDRYYHRIICSAAAAIPPRPPGKGWVAVLVLPEHSKAPYYTWTPYKLNRHGLPVFEQSSWYGSGYKTRPTFILRHPVTRQTLPQAITVFELVHPPAGPQTSHDRIEKPPAHTNLCIHNLTDGFNSSAFKGTVLVVTLARTLDRTRTWLLSFKPQDIIILLEELKRPTAQIAPPVRSKGTGAVACFPSFEPKVTFNGDNASDVKHTDHVAFESLDIPVDHPIFTFHGKDPHIYTPPLGNSYKFPIRMFRFLNYRGLRGNKFVPTVFPTVDINRSTSGDRPSVGPSKFVAAKTGAVLFARTDGKPLEVSHLKGFSEFVAHVTQTWQAYDSFMCDRERSVEEQRKEGKAKTTYVGISPEQMKMVVEMDETLEVGAFKEFWMANNRGDLGPFGKVNMDPDEDEGEDEEDYDAFDVDSL